MLLKGYILLFKEWINKEEMSINYLLFKEFIPFLD